MFWEKRNSILNKKQDVIYYISKGAFSKLLLNIKRIVENIPEPIGKYLVYAPFSLRLGSSYTQSKKDINYFINLSIDERHDYVFSRFKGVVQTAVNTNKFYQDFYKKHNFNLDQLKCFDDIKRVPVVTKSDLKKYKLEERSTKQKGRLLINTGGTSGEPLEFYIDASAFAREWAHMHYIWSKLGYKQTDLKLTFRGKNLGDKVIQYNPVHNEYIINSYKPLNQVAYYVKKIIDKKDVVFIHGYPSSIYNFAAYCNNEIPMVSKKLSSMLKGVLLGSEYPAPAYRDLIEQVFKAPTLSWYGHSEMAVLAYEEEKYSYKPLQTYGYCEAVPDSSGNYRLIGTSYNNSASPFIRYDTGDLIEPQGIEDGILDSFIIKYGRTGDFILDTNKQPISLTALIFGRHHKIFSKANFVQVYQDEPGEATLVITLPDLMSNNIEIESEFDLSNVSISFNYEIRSEPILSISGKVPLLINKSMIKENQYHD